MLEDEWAFYLFHSELDAFMPMYMFTENIKQAVEKDEIDTLDISPYTINQTPCINEVNRLIKLYKENSIAGNRK